MEDTHTDTDADVNTESNDFKCIYEIWSGEIKRASYALEESKTHLSQLQTEYDKLLLQRDGLTSEIEMHSNAIRDIVIQLSNIGFGTAKVALEEFQNQFQELRHNFNSQVDTCYDTFEKLLNAKLMVCGLVISLRKKNDELDMAKNKVRDWMEKYVDIVEKRNNEVAQLKRINALAEQYDDVCTRRPQFSVGNREEKKGSRSRSRRKRAKRGSGR